MPADVGSQSISILYNTQATSGIVNLRHKDTRETGIYTGGYLSVIDTSHVEISPLVCEIQDGTYQVRVETTVAVNLAVASATPYVILRWAYTGAVTDYMELLAVATPSTYDLVVGKCTFSGGGALQGFTYGDTSYPRNTPDNHNLFLKVQATEDTELRVRVRSGRVQTASGYTDVADQKSNLFVVPASNSKIYLVYIDRDTGAVSIDSSGTAAASPAAPDYKGKLVLAEVILASTDTNITADKIVDVRNFLTAPVEPDDTTIEFDSDGLLSVKDPLADEYLVTLHQTEQAQEVSSWTQLNIGSATKRSGISAIASNRVTLEANKLYVISYNIVFEGVSFFGMCQSRIAVYSGDTTWNLESVSRQVVARNNTGSDRTASLSGTYIIKPSSTTLIQLEVKTKGSSTWYSKVTSVSLSVWNKS